MQSVHPWVQVNRFVEFEKNFLEEFKKYHVYMNGMDSLKT